MREPILTFAYLVNRSHEFTMNGYRLWDPERKIFVSTDVIFINPGSHGSGITNPKFVKEVMSEDHDEIVEYEEKCKNFK